MYLLHWESTTYGLGGAVATLDGGAVATLDECVVQSLQCGAMLGGLTDHVNHRSYIPCATSSY